MNITPRRHNLTDYATREQPVLDLCIQSLETTDNHQNWSAYLALANHIGQFLTESLPQVPPAPFGSQTGEQYEILIGNLMGRDGDCQRFIALFRRGESRLCAIRRAVFIPASVGSSISARLAAKRFSSVKVSRAYKVPR